MTYIDTQYEDLLARIMREGADKGDRTGTGTRSIFGAQLRYDQSKGFPLITTKRVHMKSIIGELLWFLRGESNVRWLQDNGIRIWNEWADDNGDLGPVYGVQWRQWNAGDGRHIDQIEQVLQTLTTNPNSRRMIVSAWNVGDLKDMALEPCHAFFQLYVENGRLSLQLYQRSADMFLGVPFNIASYSLLTHMFAQQAGLEVGDFRASPTPSRRSTCVRLIPCTPTILRMWSWRTTSIIRRLRHRWRCEHRPDARGRNSDCGCGGG